MHNIELAIEHPTDKVNFTRVDINDLTVWFSYTTPIGFRVLGSSPVVRVNEWGPTTGKHLNHIDPDHSGRVYRDEWERLFEKATR